MLFRNNTLRVVAIRIAEKKENTKKHNLCLSCTHRSDRTRLRGAHRVRSERPRVLRERCISRPPLHIHLPFAELAKVEERLRTAKVLAKGGV